MKITKMRNVADMNQVVESLRRSFDHAGFITDVSQLTSTSIKVGLHMRSFRIDTVKLGHNADVGRCARQTKKGFKRTDTPTWQQRVEFNNIVNDTLDYFEAKANVKSGDIIVRSFESGRRDHWNSYESAWGERCYYEIVPIDEAPEKEPDPIKPVKPTLVLIYGGAA